MNIKTIALDIDGTLLDKDGKILPKTKNALLTLQEEGVKIILASGRPVKSMLKLANELELEKHKGVIISNNGSIAYDVKNHKLIFDTPLSHDLVLDILESIENRDIWPMVEDGDYMLVKNVYKGTITLNDKKLNITQKEAREGEFLLKEVDEIKNHVNHNINKILTIVEPSEIEKTVSEYKEKFQNKVHVVQTAPYFMEFVRPESNKAYGLEKLGIDPETLISFGDSMNDFEMVDYAKYGVAMGNAQAPVKKAAFYITKDNNSEGIYEALKKFGLVE